MHIIGTHRGEPTRCGTTLEGRNTQPAHLLLLPDAPLHLAPPPISLITMLARLLGWLPRDAVIEHHQRQHGRRDQQAEAQRSKRRRVSGGRDASMFLGLKWRAVVPQVV
jgi:hypothetical protein